MSSVQSLLVLSLWYLPGAAAARHMIDRGHPAPPWIFAAWIGGALCVVAAVVVRTTGAFTPRPDPTDAGGVETRDRIPR